MNATTLFLRRNLRRSIIASLVIGLSCCVLIHAGCSKEEVAAQPTSQPASQPAAQPVSQSSNQSSNQSAETQQPADANASTEKSTLRKAAELLEQAKSSGGTGAQQATKWMQDAFGDATESGGASAQDALDWTNDMYESLKDQGLTTAGSATEWLSEDWSKMGAWQYKVIVLGDLSPDETESKLNELGAQRWECFHVTSSGNGQTMYFKKHAKSYLKHVPLKDMMKLIPLLDTGNE